MQGDGEFAVELDADIQAGENVAKGVAGLDLRFARESAQQRDQSAGDARRLHFDRRQSIDDAHAVQGKRAIVLVPDEPA